MMIMLYSIICISDTNGRAVLLREKNSNIQENMTIKAILEFIFKDRLL